MSSDQDAPPRDAPLRRRADREGGGDRALDWAVRDTDVLLEPHSPLAIADVLTRPDGAFDLVPAGATGASPREPGAGAAGGPRAPRARANLLTRHDPEALRQRCRRAVVESALVRARTERRLWLAAGFLVGTDATGTALRAPLLRWPALLVCRPAGAGYELRIADPVPRANRALADRLARLHGVVLPVPDPSAPLADHFGRVAERVRALPGLELEFDVALGNAADEGYGLAAPAPGTLPDVPEAFDVPLAMALAGDVDLAGLDSILALMPDVSVSRAALPGRVSALRECAAKLAARGLEGVEFGALAGLPARLEALLGPAERALATTSVARLSGERPIEAGALARLGNIMELVDKAPPGIEHHRHPDLAYARSGALLRRARHQAQLVEDEFAALQDRFELDRIPSKTQLLQLIDRLGGAGGTVPDVVDADYFRARRQVMEFSTVAGAHVDEAQLRSLGQLARVLRFRELFVNNTEYRRALGGGYRGLRTDWVALGAAVDYAAELAEVLDSEAMAARAMGDFGAFRDALIGDLDALRAGSDALLGLLGLFGTGWRRRPAIELLAHARTTVPKLAEWRRELGDFSAHRSVTPRIVLSRLSDGTGDDAERRLRAARERIDLHLASGEGSVESVARTLEWLRAASRRAAEERLGIDAIVDHLQIA